jgi:DNA-binding beta-propeller fold protein YncE
LSFTTSVRSKWAYLVAVGLLALVHLSLGLLVATPIAAASGNAYVANGGTASISQFAIGTEGDLSSLSPSSVAAASGSHDLSVTPDGKSVYVTNTADYSISQYDIDALNGGLSPKSPASVFTAPFPLGIAVSRDSKSAYVVNSVVPGVISQYDIDPVNGTLSPKTVARVATGLFPVGVAVSPDGRSAYVTNGGGTVSEYDVDPLTGALSPKTPATVVTGGPPFGIVVAPDGKSVYVASQNTVSQYDVDPLTGALSPKTPLTVATGRDSTNLAITPDGSSAYVINRFDQTVSQYDVDPLTGALSPKTPGTVDTGAFSFSVAVSPDGKSVYVTNGGAGTVSQFDVDALTGTLSPKAPETVTAERGALGIAVRPLPFVSPKHLTTTSAQCSASTIAIGQSTTCTATVTDAAPSGQTIPTGNIDFASDGPGTFSASSCALLGTGASASCQVTYRPSAVGLGSHTITATYGGDAKHTTSIGNANVTTTTRSTSTGVSCALSTVVAGQSITCAVTVSDSDLGTRSTPTGTVSVSSSGPGRFSGAGLCTLVQTSTGVANCELAYTATATTPAPVRSDTISATYNGDSTHSTSNESASVQVLSITLLAHGAFVIGNQDAVFGKRVTFSDAQWSTLNSLSSGPAPASFKGFASQTPTNPPRCGNRWTSRPGESSSPPVAVPELTAVIASSSIGKSSASIGGDAPAVVVVRTDPGLPGKGTVAGIVCSG